MGKKSMRTEMPNTAAFIDALRDAFGADMINDQIRKGMRGEPTFYANENGHELGTPWIPGECDATNQVGG